MQPVSRHHAQDPFAQGLDPYTEIPVERDPKRVLAGVMPRQATARLPAMLQIEETCADYSATGLTTGPHLMTCLQSELKARGILSAAELVRAAHGAWVRTAGVVIVRQRPGTAKALLFVTLEDETGSRT